MTITTVDKSVIYAVGILAAWLVALVWIERRNLFRNQHNGQVSSYASKSKASNNKSERSNPDIKTQQTIEKGWHTEEREHHRKERFYWKLTSVLTFLAVSGAIATVILSLSSLDEARKAVVEARRQADIAQNTLVATTRARLKITEITDTSVTRSGNGPVAWFNFKPTYKNFGQSPAQGIFFNPHIFVVGAGPSPRRVCEEDKARQQGTTETSDEVVFPQDEGGQQWVGTQVPLDELVTGAAKIHSAQASATIYLGIVGCLTYQSTDSTTAYVTGFVADLHPADTNPDPANYVSVYDIIIGNSGSVDLKMKVKTLGAWAD